MTVPLCNIDLSPIALEITFVKISKGRSMSEVGSAIAGGFVFFMNLSASVVHSTPVALSPT
jgi:hypothetical protein